MELEALLVLWLEIREYLFLNGRFAVYCLLLLLS